MIPNRGFPSGRTQRQGGPWQEKPQFRPKISHAERPSNHFSLWRFAPHTASQAENADF